MYNKFDRECILEEYHELLKYYELPSDDENVLKLQKLTTTERAIFVLYIASDFRYGILSRMLCTNIKYAKALIENIKTKINNIE